MAEKTNMICPSCHTFQPIAEICNKCNVVIAKVQNNEIANDRASTETASKQPPILKIVGILVIAIPLIGLFAFSFSDNGQEDSLENSLEAGGMLTKTRQNTEKLSSIDRIATLNPNVAGKIQRTQVISKLHSLKTRLYMLATESTDPPPSNEEGLQHLVDNGYLNQADITDEWGATFVYKLEWGKEILGGKEYKIFIHSKGPDGISGNSDDVGMP